MEEHACLVRAHSDSENSSKLGSFGSITRTMAYSEDKFNDGTGEPGNTANVATSPPENPDGGESGDLIDYNDSSVLEQFHEDAMRQAGFGLAQLKVILAAALAIGGASMELTAIAFILPSAEIELCILPHEKNWAVMITLVGAGIGSLGWGLLGTKLGRRRMLLSCLCVNAVFAPVAATMPTYPTFMMARFCSSLGWGGVLPLSATYVRELSAGSVRRGAGGSAVAGALAAGAAAAALLAAAALPAGGKETLLENKEHFSAWHRYLLLCTLPILASLVSLIWTQESPRYLLEVGREVDAMMIYQTIHTDNQFRLFGKGTTPMSNTNNVYRLSELALPGKRRPPHVHNVRRQVKMFWQSFFQIFSSAYRSQTLSLGGTLLLVMCIQFYLASYVPATVLKIENEQFEINKKIITNLSYENELYNTTLENIEYYNVTFTNCTFRDIFVSHVMFKNCSFVASAFANIKSSYTMFEDSAFVNCTIIDTDIEIGVSISPSCTVVGTVIRGMVPACRVAHLAWRLAGRVSERLHCALATALAALPILPRPQRAHHVIACGALAALSPSLMFAESETALYIIEAVYTVIITYLFCTIGLMIVDSYPANVRCLAHGLLLSVCLLSGAAVRGFGAGGRAYSSSLCGLLACIATAISTRIR